MSEKTVLVTGATGRQGGAALRHLLQRGWRVRALTRNPEKPSARQIAELGAEVVRGDLDDPTQVRAAIAGVYGVFSVQDYWTKGVGFEGEIRQARNLIEAAKEAGVQHFVQTSIARCHEAPKVEHFRSKHEVERLIDGAGLPRTFLRTVFFMDNFIDPQVGKLMLPVLSSALDPETRFHMVAVDDIGAFAAAAFDRPDEYLGKTIDLAGDELTIAEIRQLYTETTGRKAPRLGVPRWLFRLINREMAEQFAWNNRTGWHIDVNALRARRPDLKNFRTWLEDNARTA